MTEYLSTGMDALDRQCGDHGGLPEGSLIAIEAPVGSQVESLLWTMMRTRPTVYVTTLREKAAVQDDLQGAVPDQEYTIHRAGIDTPIENTWNLLELVDQQVNVIVHPATPLERIDDRDRYVKFLNWLQNHLVNTASLGIFLCEKGDNEPRGRDLTLSLADVVWSLDVRVEGGNVVTPLMFKKFRGHEMPEEVIKLRLGKEVRVDTSRDIA